MADEQVVLVVEDDDDVRRLLVTLVADEMGAPVVAARDGQEALDRAYTHRPDVVLLDLMLPKTDGYEVARRLRADAATQGSWVVAVTAHGDAEQAFAAGCDQLLLKPLEVEDVLLCVEAALIRTRRSGHGTAGEPGRAAGHADGSTDR
ncbi:MAG TPA: response regulator [Chloroflexota bacterium]|jgi:CheY-like chemotaxis protein|nr:response regulator [Chloroflexota bacterium]